jgi:hypothetical protein
MSTRVTEAVETLARSAEREALARAIATHEQAVATLQKLRAAVPRAEHDRLERFRDIDRAEALLREAQQDQPRGYVAALLAGDDTTAGDVVDLAEARLTEARDSYDRAKRVEAALKEAIGDAERRLSYTRPDLERAISAVLQSEPAPAAGADMPGPVITRRLPGEAAAEPASSPQPSVEPQVSRPARRSGGGRATAGAAAEGGQPRSRPRANARLGYANRSNRLTEDSRYPWRGYPADSWVPK